ncbi:MAG: host-nuclease inhibitor Gam family protein [Candidatus Cloacimonadaceae bacterium]
MKRTKNEKFTTPAHREADRLLAAWDAADRDVRRLEAEANKEMAETLNKWAETIKAAKYKRDALGAAIKDMEKEHHMEYFGETGPAPVSSSVALPHGTLLYDKTEYVVKPRKADVLGNLEKYGFEEAIRRDPAVDWEALNDPEEWPDALLAVIGTRREVKETYGFQIKEPQNEKEAVGAVSQRI